MFHAEGVEMWRARRVPELFASLLDLSLSATSTTQRPLRETLEAYRIKPQILIRKLQCRHWKFHDVEDIESHFQPLVFGGDSTEINIRCQVPLPVAFDIGPVEGDVSVLIPAQVFIGAEHAFGPGSDGDIEPARDAAFRKKGAEVGTEPVGLTVIIFQKPFGSTAPEDLVALFAQFRIAVGFAVKGEFHLDALFIPGQFLCHQQPTAEEIGPEIGPAPSPFGTEAIKHFDHRLIEGPAHAAEPDPFFAVDARPPPEFHAGLALGVSAVGMPDLVHLVPFPDVVERMKIGLRIILVPGGVESDHGGAVTDDVGAGDDACSVFYLALCELIA